MLGTGSVIGIITALLPYIMKVLEKVIPDQDKLEEARRGIEELALKNQSELYGAMKDVMVADSASGDAYTSRARPTIVYWSVGLITIIAGLGMFDMAEPVINSLKAVPTELWDLMTYGIGAFMLGRTGEKIAEGIMKK